MKPTQDKPEVAESVLSAMQRLWSNVFPRRASSMPDAAMFANHIISEIEWLKQGIEHRDNLIERLEEKVDNARTGVKLALFWILLLFASNALFVYLYIRNLPL